MFFIYTNFYCVLDIVFHTFRDSGFGRMLVFILADSEIIEGSPKTYRGYVKGSSIVLRHSP